METPDAFTFLSSLKKNSLFGGETLLKQLLIRTINKFLENCDQNSLDTRSFSAIFHQLLEVYHCAPNYQTRATNKKNKSKLKKFFYIQNRELQVFFISFLYQ